jgi:hypothetical protein
MTIGSPVTHGTVGGHLPVAVTEPTLTAGVTYRVSVTLSNSTNAYKDFTP